MKEWLRQRRELVEALGAELRAGFQAVAQFQAAEYLDCVERQETLALRIAAHDRAMPLPDSDPEAMRAAAAELGRMNAELARLNDIHRALIEAGSRSVRTFQRVWALGAAAYDRPQLASEPKPPGSEARTPSDQRERPRAKVASHPGGQRERPKGKAASQPQRPTREGN